MKQINRYPLLTRFLLLAGTTFFPLSAWSNKSCYTPSSVSIFDLLVIESRSYDRRVFTQGFFIDSQYLWVSSDLYGESFIERKDWPSGKNKMRLDLSDNLFAEGVTIHKGKVYLLSWKSQQMFTIDPEQLNITGIYPLQGQGWGVTSDGDSLWLSNGTARLKRWRDGAVEQTLSVTLKGRPLPRLNELEWIGNEIWANVWMTDQIVTIDPDSGQITRIIDLTNLLPKNERARNTDVLNGIAQDPKTGAIWVTGKRWPTMYRIELIERPQGNRRQ